MSQILKINNDSNLFMGAYQMPSKLCDEIIDSFENCPNKENYVDTPRGYICHAGMSVFLKYPEVINSYIKFLYTCLEKYKNKYEACQMTDAWHFDNSFNIQKYPPGEYYNSVHAEISYSFPNIKRHIVFMTYLNTIKEGGGTKFLNQNLVVQPKKGLTLFWPAHWTHVHVGIPAPNETKYIVTGWYEYADDHTFFKSVEEFLAKKQSLNDMFFLQTK